NISINRSDKYTTFSADFIFSRHIGDSRFRRHNWIKWLKLIVMNPLEFRKFSNKVRKRIWYTIPTVYATKTTYYDAFFILALPLAIANQEELVFEGTISSELLKKTKRIETYYHEIYKKKTVITVKTTKHTKEDTPYVGQCFTLGVDSFYTLCCYTNKQDPPLRHLLYVDGYDIPFYQKKFLNEIHMNIKKVATRTNTKAIFVETNLRELTDHIIGWGRYHVSALVAVATFTNMKKVYINGESFEFPDWGLRFGVDKMYSSSYKQIQFIAHNVLREKKLEQILTTSYTDLFLQYVRVCWENVGIRHLPYNCSSCQKCIKTQLSLFTLGVTKTPTFLPLDIESVEKIHLVEHVYAEWQELYKKLQQKENVEPALLTAISEVLKKPMRV
ncbi:MAG TPA: hypothetical protein PLS49_09750, partial [Candidatus Woesebacteria bacterium]|nr:hypothetical protein [Candidatus Woesebacteria bacterium]